MKKTAKRFSSSLSRKTPFLCLGLISPFVLSSCGSEESTIEYIELADTGLENSGYQDYDFSLLESYYDSHKDDYPSLDSDSLSSITLNDLKLYATGSTSSLLLDDVEKLMQDFYFEYNSQEDALLEYSRFYNNNAFDFPTVNRDGRSPYRSEMDVKYFRTDYLDLKLLESGDISFLDSSFLKDANLDDDQKQIVLYNVLASSFQLDTKSDETVTSSRILDANFQTSDVYSGLLYGAESFSIIRTRVSGDEIYNSSTDDFSSTFDDYYELYPGLIFEVVTENGTTEEFDTVEAFATYIDSNEVTEFSFKTNDNVEGISYAYAVSEGNIKYSDKYTFQASDLLLGFIRNLYTDSDLREKGLFMGTEDIGLPKLTDAEITALEDEYGSNYEYLDNYNFYLFDLYNLDIAGTINSNLNDELQITNPNTFTLKFEEEITSTTLNLFLDTSVFTPVPNSLFSDENYDKNSPGHLFGIVDYGTNDNTNQTIDYSKPYYSLAPYVQTSYGTSEGDLNVFVANDCYPDLNFQSNNNKIDKVTIWIDSAEDPNSWESSRAFDFETPTESYNYILDPSVLNVDDWVDNGTYYKVFQASNTTYDYQRVMWSPYAGQEGFYNDFGLEMMYGKGNDTVDKVNSNPNALDEFYNGSGSTLRQSFYAAINWYSVGNKYYFPDQNMEFYPWITGEGNNEISFSNTSYSTKGTYFDCDLVAIIGKEEFDSFYDTNESYDYFEQLKIKSVLDKDNFTEELSSFLISYAARSLDDLATSVGATAESPALIPIFEYNFKDGPLETGPEAVNQEVLNILNSLTPRVEFYYPYEDNAVYWDDFYVSAKVEYTSYEIFVGFGSDYDGVGSILHQTGCSYGNFANFYIVKSALL